MTTFCPPLFQIAPKLIEARAALPRHPLRKGICPQESHHGFPAQTEFPGDRTFGEATLVCRLDSLESCLSPLAVLLNLLLVKVQLDQRSGGRGQADRPGWLGGAGAGSAGSANWTLRRAPASRSSSRYSAWVRLQKTWKRSAICWGRQPFALELRTFQLKPVLCRKSTSTSNKSAEDPVFSRS